MFGTLEFVPDEVYMPKVYPKISSATYVIMCARTGLEAQGMLVEKSVFDNTKREETLGSMV